MIIPIASDHAGYQLKEKTIQLLEKMGHTPIDFGTHSEESVDYPDFAAKVASRVNDNEFEQGILLCGSGQGVCMAANKFPKIRAALVYSADVAHITRLHNNANIMCLPGRQLTDDELADILKAWFKTEFEGGRHERRVNKIESITRNYSKS